MPANANRLALNYNKLHMGATVTPQQTDTFLRQETWSETIIRNMSENVRSTLHQRTPFTPLCYSANVIWGVDIHLGYLTGVSYKHQPSISMGSQVHVEHLDI